MIRETLSPDSVFADVVITPANGTSFQRRTTTGGSATHTFGPAATVPHWVKLVRSGDTFTGSVSPDGSAWTEVGSETIGMGPSAYIGLAVTAHHDGALNCATFDSIGGSGGWAGGGGGNGGGAPPPPSPGEEAIPAPAARPELN